MGKIYNRKLYNEVRLNVYKSRSKQGKLITKTLTSIPLDPLYTSIFSIPTNPDNLHKVISDFIVKNNSFEVVELASSILSSVKKLLKKRKYTVEELANVIHRINNEYFFRFLKIRARGPLELLLSIKVKEYNVLLGSDKHTEYLQMFLARELMNQFVTQLDQVDTLSEEIVNHTRVLIPYSANIEETCRASILLALGRQNVPAPLRAFVETLYLDPENHGEEQEKLIAPLRFPNTLKKIRNALWNHPQKYCDENNAYQLMEYLFPFVHYGVGNCGETSLISMLLWLEYYEFLSSYMFSTRIERLNLSGDSGADHAFLIINRTKGSDISDPSTWGEHAIICDPWQYTSFLVNGNDEKPEIFDYIRRNLRDIDTNINTSHQFVIGPSQQDVHSSYQLPNFRFFKRPPKVSENLHLHKESSLMQM